MNNQGGRSCTLVRDIAFSSLGVFMFSYVNAHTGFRNTAADGTITYSRVLTSNKQMALIRPRVSESNAVALQLASITMSFQVLPMHFACSVISKCSGTTI